MARGSNAGRAGRGRRHKAGYPPQCRDHLRRGDQPGALQLPGRAGAARAPQEVLAIEPLPRVVPATAALIEVEANAEQGGLGRPRGRRTGAFPVSRRCRSGGGVGVRDRGPGRGGRGGQVLECYVGIHTLFVPIAFDNEFGGIGNRVELAPFRNLTQVPVLQNRNILLRPASAGQASGFQSSQPVQQRPPQRCLGAGAGGHADVAGGWLVQHRAADETGERQGGLRRHDAVAAGDGDEGRLGDRGGIDRQSGDPPVAAGRGVLAVPFVQAGPGDLGGEGDAVVQPVLQGDEQSRAGAVLGQTGKTAVFVGDAPRVQQGEQRLQQIDGQGVAERQGRLQQRQRLRPPGSPVPGRGRGNPMARRATPGR